MSRATQHLNRNRQFLVGIAAMAFAVLFVVILFLSLCFGKMEAPNKDKKNYYQLELASSFLGQETQLYVNDSLLFDALVETDTLKIQFSPFDEQHQLFVVDKESGNTRSFNLQEKACKVLIQKNNEGRVDILQKDWEKE